MIEEFGGFEIFYSIFFFGGGGGGGLRKFGKYFLGWLDVHVRRDFGGYSKQSEDL